MTMLSHLKKLTAIAVTLLASSTIWAQSTIRLGTEGAYPPFNYYDSNGQLAGFDIDIGNALCEQMGANCVWVAQDWDGIIPALMAGRYDVILASMFITDRRMEQVSFTDPYQASAMTFVGHKSANITDVSPAALAGKTIGAQGSTTQGDFLEAQYPDSTIRLYPTQDAVNLDLANGRLDLQAGDIIPMVEWLQTQEGSCCERVGELITDPEYVGYGVGMAVRKNDDALRERLNAALAAIIENGVYEEINNRYFDVNLLTLK